MRRAESLFDSIGARAGAVTLACLVAAIAGCSSAGSASDDPLTRTRLAEAPARAERRGNDPPAIIDSEAVPWSSMQALLAEAAGAQVLEELTLDRALALEARRRGLTISDEQVRAEELNLLRTLRESGAALDDAAGRQVLDDLRRRRGLGPIRYQALLRRTATLRALVQDRVDLTDEATRRAFELMHGERYRVRIITVDSTPAADAALARLAAGDPFGEVAARFSTDASGPSGGLIDPISAADLNYPSALRESIRRLAPGDVAGPVAIDRGLAIVRLEEVIPADGVRFEEVRQSVEREARIAQERSLMSELAGSLLAQSGVTPLDPSLAWSWRQRR